MKGYFASHFFNAAMFQWTEEIATLIEKETGLELYVPQRNKDINDKKNNDAEITDIKIADADLERLKESNVLICCIDGQSMDEGVMGEVGYFAALMDMQKDKPRTIIAIYTDMRQFGTGDNHLYRNLFITGVIRKRGSIVGGEPDKEDYKVTLIKEIKDFMIKYN
ncbi:nucleoside 2-deoxyribosyltransferase [Alkaliphilus sp. B6464]|uniref:nucleoside 2-deoxyribosyltransferase n=1 Tax=Alkaliphilus sp. B6464 TaxID=2731219 RepID=UPI001BADC7AC|nr:nucleoside 2-deoxyribosyltransferase [Alkaliphilus sp. B6464]QUH21856.1 nucleoside 2-deoxyribosyltransferase [Alkaliphilus sp. B6464]